MRKLIIGLLATGLLLAANAAHEPTTLGTFLPRPALTVYVVGDGQPATLRVTVHNGSRPEGDRLMVRWFDPDEQLAFWQYVEPGRMQDTYFPGGGEVYGIPLRIPQTYQPGGLLYDTDLQLTGKGVYQLRLAAGACNASVELSLSRPLPYGVSFQNGPFTAWSKTLADAYVYVPPRTELLNLSGGPITIADAAGNQLLTSEAKAKKQTLTVSQSDTVWRLTFTNPADWQCRIDGFPFIICPTAEAAQAIRGSIVECQDGAIVAWQFQRRIHDVILPQVLAKTGNTGDLIRDLHTVRDALLADPVRNLRLVNAFDGLLLSINPLLKSQNLDPTSHWAGALDAWQERASLPAPENRWDRYQYTGLRAGLGTHKTQAGAEKLALAATLDSPANPWFGQTALLYRAAAAALADLQAMAEDEIWRDADAASDPYPGFMGFVFGQKTFPAFAVAGPLMPADIRDIWTEGLRHLVDRSYPDGLVTCRNQSSHYLEAFAAFAIGSGLPRYQELSHAYNQRFLAGTARAGYQMEQCGPDGSYIGMTNWHMAVAYRLSHDPAMLEAVKRSYTFFNYTVAPEPNGRMIGGFNFNHRVGTPFSGEQWGGAKGIMDDVLPEVGLWANSYQSTPEQATKSIESIFTREDPSDSLSSNYAPAVYNIEFPRYAYAGKPDTSGIWPAEDKPFIRDIGGELIAVKRPGYYTVIYVGKAAPVQHYIMGQERLRDPLPDDAENQGGRANVRKGAPFTGGGMSLFWSPDYGSSLLGGSWSPLCHHGLVGSSADGKRGWEEYFAVRYQLDAEAGELTVSGKMTPWPIAYTRHYSFKDDAVEITLTLTAEEDVTLANLIEVLPVAEGAIKANGATLATTPTGFTLRDDKGAGLDVTLAGEPSVHLQPNGLQDANLQIGRAEITLPTSYQAGVPITLHYTLTPVAP